MMNSIEELRELHNKIREMGWVPSIRNGNTGIGKTYESLLGKLEDNLALPDFKDIEIKSKRELTNSFVTLFTKAPDYPPKANTVLREEFGQLNEEFGVKKLHTSIFNCDNTFIEKYCFSLSIDHKEEKIFIVVKDFKTKEIISNNIYYNFNSIEAKLKNKINKLALIGAEVNRDEVSRKEKFKYTTLALYKEPKIENFLKLLEDNKIMVDIRIGFYKNKEAKNYGRTHDHGTGFRISEKFLVDLYSKKEEF